MRAMKDSGIAWIGEIPEEWKIVRNKNAFVCNKELVGEKSALTQLLSLTTRGIKKKDINNAEGKLPESFDTYQFVRENDIVMCLFDLDCSAVFSGISPIDGMISPAYRVLSCKECIEPRYADYWFRYISDGRKFNHFAKNIRYTLSYEEFSALPLLLPKKVEQHRIADYLDRKCSQIDAIIAWQQEVIEKLKTYKLSVITEAVTKGLNPHAPMKDSGVEWIGEIPEHWEVRKAAFICDRLVVGVVIKPAEYFDDKGTIPFLRGINLKEYSINTDNLVYITDETNKMLSKSIVRSGDILIVRDGNIGVACVVPPFLDGANVVSMIIMTPMKRYNSCYICYFINSSIGKLQFELTKIGSALTHTSVSAVSKLRLAIPPEEEQNKIVEFLDEKCSSIEMLISKKQVIVDNLIAYKKSLIYEVVTGKKEV